MNSYDSIILEYWIHRVINLKIQTSQMQGQCMSSNSLTVQLSYLLLFIIFSN